MRTGLTIGVAALAMAGGALVTGTAASAGTTPTPARIKAVCARVDSASVKVDKTVAIIEGGVGTKGSIAYLTARITKVENAGHPKEADLLKERLTVRNDRLTTLKARQTLLASYKQVCSKALGTAS